MHEHHSLAPVKFFEHRGKGRIAQPFGPGLVAVVRDDTDSTRFENVEPVFDLAQTALNVRKRHDRKQSEASRVTTSKIGRVVVTEPRRAACGVSIAEPDAR
jgi:hypothetical protein